MSRVHDALKKAEQLAAQSANEGGQSTQSIETERVTEEPSTSEASPSPTIVTTPVPVLKSVQKPAAEIIVEPQKSVASLTGLAVELSDILEQIEEIPFNPWEDAHIIDPSRPYEVPAEEFKTLRTRLNHLQSLQPIRSLVITSPSPAEGKSMTAANLAIAEAQLTNNPTLIADFDFRRPMVHQLFQIDRGPGITDFLMGKAELSQIIRKVAGLNLYVMTAGQAVLNPLELLNLPQAKNLLKALPQVFNWALLDSPPLLFAADAALLGTMTDGTVLVVRMNTTTVDSVTKAIQSVCENNILGVIVNGSTYGDSYSKYNNYYQSYYQEETEE